MCGRYVLHLAPMRIRQWLAQQNMPVDEEPDEDDDRVRPTYNFAPGYHGLIYRADTGDRGGRSRSDPEEDAASSRDGGSMEPSPKKAKLSHPPSSANTGVDVRAAHDTRYKLQVAKWGLIPFWTKRPPDYTGQLRTINCRDDSLMTSGGMWTTMKQRKRCIVVAEGFFEWLKKNNGKEKLPHYVKRTDGALMCFAGLWDMVQYEGSEEKLYSYTIITTDPNKQLTFLHDRMPVILEPGSEAMKTWLNPANDTWTLELQAVLKPFQGELDCYPVDKAVGKVGNNSPSFVVPLYSKENKNNIANFFDTQQANVGPGTISGPNVKEQKVKQDEPANKNCEDRDDRDTTIKVEGAEDNAPLPKPKDDTAEDVVQKAEKNSHRMPGQDLFKTEVKLEPEELGEEAPIVGTQRYKSFPKMPADADKPDSSKPASPLKKASSPSKKAFGTTPKKRSATSNESVAKTPTKNGNARITNFFSSK